ncbi:MAG: 5'-methylthioadenosine/adenosylhomocysteine nucleosidase, partial [Thiovulaceae bacterium]|nr:5'-methylthioadenosine/adenosylhomocysteine nucleosidase [Sulfurimonadaceae bacterium]
MKIAIMGAMPEEIAPLLAKVGTYETQTYAGNTYYLAHYSGHDLVIAYSKIGKVFSSLTATTMIEKYACEKLLFSGVAGAINKELHIGDLIIARQLCQHDLDITAFGHPHGFVPEGSVYVDSDKELNSIAKKVAASQDKKLIEGIIATGDQFIHDSAKNDWIGETFKADALEMEGASVAVVCNALEIPFFILRAISDSADMDANFDFDK